jgi:hypothetical protein
MTLRNPKLVDYFSSPEYLAGLDRRREQLANEVPNKETFQLLSDADALGNHLQIWYTAKDMYDSGHSQHITIRGRKASTPGFVGVTSPVTWEEDFAARQKEIGIPCKIEDYYFQEIPPPNELRPANFEIGPAPYAPGMVLYMETETDRPLRGISGRVPGIVGAQAKLQLYSTIRQDSKLMLEEIWEKYPHAIIEASEFRHRHGIMKKHLVIWEVRNY